VSSLSEWITAILDSPLIRLLLVVLAVSGPVLAVFFYKRGRREKLPQYDIRSNNIVKGLAGKYDLLQVLYDGRQVQNLAVSRVILWNAGRETIQDSDVPKAAPMLIQPVGNCSILDVRIVAQNNPASNFRISKNRNGSASFQFEYMDKNQGAVIQVVHTGTSSRELDVTGTVKGAGNLIRKDLTIQPARLARRQGIVGVGVILIGLAEVAITLAFPGVEGFLMGDREYILTGILLVVLGMVLLGGFLTRRTRFVPRGLEAFGESL